jgi:pimeloyl-ACP methyl ester carboxylesterase
MSTDLHDVRVETAGDPATPLVVLIHGSMDRSAGMLRLSRRLCNDHHVVRYDRRGYGRSKQLGPPFDVTAHVDDVIGVIESNGGPAHLLGHSFGGNVALAAAQRRPDLVSTVAVYETPLSWLDWWPGTSAGGQAVAETQSGKAVDLGDVAEAFMRRLVGDELWERLPTSTRVARRSEGPAMVAELTDLRQRAPWIGERIGVPVLALCGEQARAHHRQGAETLAAMIPDARFAVLPGAGHGAPNSHATELAAVVREFFSSSAD